MNHRVRKYTPIYLSPQHQKGRGGERGAMSPNWKTYLKQEVEDRYNKLKETKLNESPVNLAKS